MVVKHNYAGDGVDDGGADNDYETSRYHASRAVRDGNNDDDCGHRDQR